jgi:hypothetical protein
MFEMEIVEKKGTSCRRLAHPEKPTSFVINLAKLLQKFIASQETNPYHPSQYEIEQKWVSVTWRC